MLSRSILKQLDQTILLILKSGDPLFNNLILMVTVLIEEHGFSHHETWIATLTTNYIRVYWLYYINYCQTLPRFPSLCGRHYSSFSSQHVPLLHRQSSFICEPILVREAISVVNSSLCDLGIPSLRPATKKSLKSSPVCDQHLTAQPVCFPDKINTDKHRQRIPIPRHPRFQRHR